MDIMRIEDLTNNIYNRDGTITCDISGKTFKTNKSYMKWYNSDEYWDIIEEHNKPFKEQKNKLEKIMIDFKENKINKEPIKSKQKQLWIEYNKIQQKYRDLTFKMI